MPDVKRKNVSTKDDAGVCACCAAAITWYARDEAREHYAVFKPLIPYLQSPLRDSRSIRAEMVWSSCVTESKYMGVDQEIENQGPTKGC